MPAHQGIVCRLLSWLADSGRRSAPSAGGPRRSAITTRSLAMSRRPAARASRRSCAVSAVPSVPHGRARAPRPRTDGHLVLGQQDRPQGPRAIARALEVADLTEVGRTPRANPAQQGRPGRAGQEVVISRGLQAPPVEAAQTGSRRPGSAAGRCSARRCKAGVCRPALHTAQRRTHREAPLSAWGSIRPPTLRPRYQCRGSRCVDVRDGRGFAPQVGRRVSVPICSGNTRACSYRRPRVGTGYCSR